jgi:hypothetical protein
MLIGSDGSCNSIFVADDQHLDGEYPDPEIARAERMFEKLQYVDGRVVIPADLEYIEALLDRAEQKSRGDKVSHHVAPGSMGQDEVLACLGSCLWEELQHLYRQMLSNQRSWILLQHSITKALRKTFEMKVNEREGNRIMEELLAEVSTFNSVSRTYLSYVP